MPINVISPGVGPSGEMLKLGPFVFKVDTAAYQTLQRTTEYRWATQDRLNARPAEQWVGPGADKINLSGTVYPMYTPGAGVPGRVTEAVGTGQIERMRLMANEGEPLMLVDGRGRVYGRWVITSIQETASHFFNNGAPQKQQFSLDLRQYGDRSTASLANAITTSQARQ